MHQVSTKCINILRIYALTNAQDISNHKFQIILTSPEMLLKHEHFSKLMRIYPSFANHVPAMIIDEAR